MSELEVVTNILFRIEDLLLKIERKISSKADSKNLPERSNADNQVVDGFGEEPL